MRDLNVTWWRTSHFWHGCLIAEIEFHIIPYSIAHSSLRLDDDDDDDGGRFGDQKSAGCWLGVSVFRCAGFFSFKKKVVQKSPTAKPPIFGRPEWLLPQHCRTATGSLEEQLQ